MSTVAFLLKRDQPDAVTLCQRLVTALRERGEIFQELVIHNNVHVPAGLRAIDEHELPVDLRLLVVLGGDGTLLYGAGLLKDPRTPILGINLGHLGFLTACSPDGAVDTLHKAWLGQLVVEERQRLNCRVLRGATVLAERTAVNDAVLSQSEKTRLMEVAALVDGELITTYRADGLIIATPTGSTAYNLAAGGPILMPQIQGVVLTPICPHTLTARPLVAPMTSTIEVRGERSSDSILLSIDGQWRLHLQPGDVVQITCAQRPLHTYRVPGRTFFELLKTKLHWGLREGRE